jgi:hypothetical protein
MYPPPPAEACAGVAGLIVAVVRPVVMVRRLVMAVPLVLCVYCVAPCTAHGNGGQWCAFARRLRFV